MTAAIDTSPPDWARRTPRLARRSHTHDEGRTAACAISQPGGGGTVDSIETLGRISGALASGQSGVEPSDLFAVFSATPGVNLLIAPDAPHFTVLAASAEWLATMTSTREETVGRRLLDVFAGDNTASIERSHVARVRASLEAVLRTDAAQRMHPERIDIRRTDGTWEERCWQPSIVPVLGESGAVRYFVYQLHDVTTPSRQRLAAEAAWRIVEAEHARAESILETMGDAHYVMDRDLRIITSNGAMERALGMPRSEWIGRTQWEAFPGSVGTPAEVNLRRVVQEGSSMHWTQHNSDHGLERDVEVDAYQTDEGGVAVFWRDITERARAAALLRESEARYRSLFESLDEGFCVIEVHFDNDGGATDYCYIETNPAFVAQTGLHDAVGRCMRDLVPRHESQWFEMFGRVATTGEPARFEAPAAALGRHYTVYAFRVGAPSECRVAVLFRDVAEQKEAERERARLLSVAEAERASAEAANHAKSEFLAVMSHELRTPLNAIDGYAELMELGLRGPLTTSQREDIARIRKSQRYLLGLINGVLNYAKIDAGVVHYDVEDVALDEVLATCEALVSPQAKAKGITLDSSGCDRTLVAIGDREKTQQVVLNLLSNALKFTSDGGFVLIGCEALDDPRVAIQVSDTGRGIDAHHLERVFQPFVQVDAGLTRTQEGVGLGLAISRDLARGMGGDLHVSSSPGEGSVFTMTLQRKIPAGEAPKARS